MSAPPLHLVDKSELVDESEARAASPGPKKARSKKRPRERDAHKTGQVANKATTAKSRKVAALSSASAGARASVRKAAAGRVRTAKRESTARDLMRSPAVCCRSEDSLNTAALLMWEHDLGAIVVVNADHKPVGMITDRDACMAAYTQGVALVHGQVASAMASSIVLCSEMTPVTEIRKLMADAQVRRVPVVDAAGQLVGIIAWSDMMRDALGPLPKDRKRGNNEKAIMQVFASILGDANA